MEFNDYGDGVAISLEPPQRVGRREIQRVRKRQQDILEVAQLLNSERTDREAQRRRDRERRARLDAASIRAARDAYYPSGRRGFSPFLLPRSSNRFRGFGRGRQGRNKVYSPDLDYPRGRSRGQRSGKSQPAAPPSQAIFDLNSPAS